MNARYAEDPRAQAPEAEAHEAEEVGRPGAVGQQELHGEEVEQHAHRASEAVLAGAPRVRGRWFTGSSATRTPIQDATAGMKRCISP